MGPEGIAAHIQKLHRPALPLILATETLWSDGNKVVTVPRTVQTRVCLLDLAVNVFDLGKPCCFRPFFDDEPDLRIAENAVDRAKLAQNPHIFLCGYGERTQAIGAGDDVVLPIARHPDWCSVPLHGRARRSVMQ